MNYWQEHVRIGTRTYPRFIGGPLDGVTDSPFRRLVRAFSPDNLLYTEMRHVQCVAHDRGGARTTLFDDSERPLQFQLTTNSTQFLERAMQRVLQRGVDGIDLNIACPARGVIHSKSGSAVMADPVLLKQVLTIMRAQTTLPLTVKMRAGFKEKNAITIAQLVQDCGVDALAIHPRLQTEGFVGPFDYSLVAAIRQSVTIPVLYSGGIAEFADAAHVYEQTGVDGFLIGRALWAAPYKLAQLDAHAQGKAFVVDDVLLLRMALQHLVLLESYYGDEGKYRFRKFVVNYIKDRAHAADVRARLMRIENSDEVKRELTAFFMKDE